jgi:hypothetical protein
MTPVLHEEFDVHSEKLEGSGKKMSNIIHENENLKKEIS